RLNLRRYSRRLARRLARRQNFRRRARLRIGGGCGLNLRSALRPDLRRTLRLLLAGHESLLRYGTRPCAFLAYSLHMGPFPPPASVAAPAIYDHKPGQPALFVIVIKTAA